jgi:hypothetical protein
MKREEKAMTTKLLTRVLGCALGFSVALSLAQTAEAKTYKMYLSMSYIGNDWQAEAANMVKAMAGSKLMRDKVTLGVQVAGPRTRNARSNRSTLWLRPEPTPSSSIRSRPLP